MESKKYFKLYKSGKQWITAAVILTTATAEILLKQTKLSSGNIRTTVLIFPLLFC
ncbi:KxYKxGKxW signal peptide domain-containing protein [Limosilactobacillus agrestis]|uniref:KxYKxGKxW signal peptide domain-containing protein n=1 Tax=Limosilactobacillus agrestis TaxID=2759748 RepID=UPI0039E001B7